MDENRQQPSIDELQAVLKRLTTDQIRFVVSRQEHISDRAAAEAVGIRPATISDWKYNGAPIDLAVRLMAMDGIIVARELRRRNLAKAMATKVAGLDLDDAKLRQAVATEIIEWEMGTATQRRDVTTAGMPIDSGPLVIIAPADLDVTDDDSTHIPGEPEPVGISEE